MSIKDGIIGAMIAGGGSGNGSGGSVVVPDINATAETLSAGSEATVQKTGSNTNVTFNFGIPQGIQGNQGPMGPQGVAGPTGATGPSGAQGATGPAGPQGEKGETGAAGPQGPAGPAGPTGQTGPTGAQGIQGEQGEPGAPFLISKIYDTYEAMNAGYASDGLEQGRLVAIATDTGGSYGGWIYVKGPSAYQFFYDISTTEGIQGPQGPAGPQGPQGEQGPVGPTGPQGEQGIQGETGPAGPAGPTGATGPQGSPGETGPAGAQGPAGPQGEQGVQGPTGPAGATGPAGPGVPTGGTTGQVLAKASGTDYDTQWVNQTGGGGGGPTYTPGNGISIDGTTLSAKLSQTAGNAALFGGDGGIFVPESNDPYIAGPGIQIQGQTVQALISPATDNATQIYNGAIYTPATFQTTLKPLIVVTTIPNTPNIQVTVTKGTSAITAQTNESGVAEIEVNSFGTWTVSGTISGEAVNTQVVVSSIQLYSALLGEVDPILNNNTWETISKVSNANLASAIWSVGDGKQIQISSTIGTKQYQNFQPWVFILGINHNAAIEGEGIIHFGCFHVEQNQTEKNEMVLDDQYYSSRASQELAFCMNFAGTNAGGWESCTMRTLVLGANSESYLSATQNSFLSALPADLGAVLKKCKKYTDNVGGGATSPGNVTETQDMVALPSEYEIFGTTQSSNPEEASYQKQYEYYLNGNDIISYLQSAPNTAAYKSLRSPSAGSPSYFLGVYPTGTCEILSANNSYGIGAIIFV